MLNLRLYMLQRVTALLMAPFVLVHLGVMIYAIQGGVSATEILSRTQGSLLWFAFYGTFVVAVAIHGAIGVRVVLHEWAGVKAAMLDWVTWGIGFGLLLLGAQAVWGVTFAVGPMGADG